MVRVRGVRPGDAGDALVPVIIVVGLLVVGCLFFLWLLIFRREVLETEPGDLNVFQH